MSGTRASGPAEVRRLREEVAGLLAELAAYQAAAVEASTVQPTYAVTHLARGWTSNAQRRMHWSDQAANVAEWRHAFKVLALEAKVPRLERVSITVVTQLTTYRSEDVGANWPAVKAGIDGLTDAKVFPDDSPDHLTALTFLAPILGAERDAVTLRITPAPVSDTG